MSPIQMTLKSNLLVILLTSSISMPCFAGTEIEDSLNLFKEVKKTLKLSFTRPEAPEHFQHAYLKLRGKKGTIKREISENPSEVSEIIDRNLKESKLSHLDFRKLQKGTLGFESVPIGDGTEEIIRILPGSELAKKKIRIGDTVRTIGGIPASEALTKGLVEGSTYDKDVAVEFSLKRSIPIIEFSRSDRLYNSFGMSTPTFHEGSRLEHRTADIVPNGHPDQAGILEGDTIDEINNQPTNHKNKEADAYKVGDIVPFKLSRTINLEIIGERKLKQGTLGIIYAATDDGGLSIIAIQPNSPADRAGLKLGDVILKVNGIPSQAMENNFFPGEKVRYTVKKITNGQVTDIDIVLAIRADYERTTLDESKEGFPILRLPDLGSSYDPEVVHSAFRAAEKTQFLVIDLRNNPGGLSNHLLSYLLSPQTKSFFRLGHPLQIQDAYGKVFSQALSSLLKYEGDLNEIKSKPGGTELTRARAEYGETLKSNCVEYLKNHRSIVLQTLDELSTYFFSIDDFSNFTELMKERKMSFENLVDRALMPTCESIHQQETEAELIAELDQLKNLPTTLSGGLNLCKDPEQNRQQDNERPESQIFDQHFDLIWKWYEQTLQMLGAEIKKSYLDLTANRISKYTPETHHLGRKIKESPFPFKGKVAFVVDKTTFCAAEICAGVPMEYLTLKKNRGTSKIKDPEYKDELYPEDVIVIGETQGGAQGLSEQEFRSSSGAYVLSYPLYDVVTPVYKKRIEGSGIQGVPVRKSTPETLSADPALDQAIEWGLR